MNIGIHLDIHPKFLEKRIAEQLQGLLPSNFTPYFIGTAKAIVNQAVQSAITDQEIEPEPFVRFSVGMIAIYVTIIAKTNMPNIQITITQDEYETLKDELRSLYGYHWNDDHFHARDCGSKVLDAIEENAVIIPEDNSTVEGAVEAIDKLFTAHQRVYPLEEQFMKRERFS